MATVAELLNEFVDRINQPRESSYVGATTPAARQYVSLLKRVANELLKRFDGWSQLKRTYTFTTTTGVANYQLPGDFLRLLTGTQWGVTNQIPLAGPLSNARLAFQTYGVDIASPYAGWQVNGAQGYIFNLLPYTQRSAGYFQISPAGQDSTTEMVMAYVSSNWVWPTPWVPSTAYVYGDKRTGINNIYICTVAGTSSTTRPSATSGTIVDGTASWAVYNEPYPPAADTDFVILDDELFIEGMRWCWYQSKKQDYADLKREWEMSVRSAIGRQNGAAVVNAAGVSSYEWPNVAQSSWPGTGDV